VKQGNLSNLPLVAVTGFVEGFWENLANFKPAKPVRTGKSLFRGRNIVNLADASP